MSLRCGVVGLGFMGGCRVDALRRSAGVDEIVGTDLAADRGIALLGDGYRKTFDDLLAEGLDALFVCTPDPLHTDYAVEGLRRGLPVFVEKPLATSLADCRRILAAEAASTASVTVGQSLRMSPRYVAAQARVAAGDVGRVMHITSRRNWPLSEGQRMSSSTDLAMYLGVHEADLFHWVVGDRIARVFAAGAPVGKLPLQNAPAILVTVVFAGGAIGAIETSWAIPESAGLALSDAGMTVSGTCGLLRAAGPDLGVVLLGDPAVPPAVVDGDDVPQHGRFEHLSTREVAGFVTDELELETARFLRAVTDHTDPYVSAREGAAAVAVAAAIRRSLETGEAQDVEHLAQDGDPQ